MGPDTDRAAPDRIEQSRARQGCVGPGRTGPGNVRQGRAGQRQTGLDSGQGRTMGSATGWDGWDTSHPIFYFLTQRLWALHGKNRLQKAFVPLNIRRVAELLGRTRQYKAGWNRAAPDRADEDQTGPDTIGQDRGCQAGQGRAGYDLVGTVRPHMQLFMPGGPKETRQAQRNAQDTSTYSWYT